MIVMAEYSEADAKKIASLLSKYRGKTVALFGGNMVKDYDIDDVGILKDVKLESTVWSVARPEYNIALGDKLYIIVMTIYISGGSNVFHGDKTITPHFGSWQLAVKK
jgi:hypothetical protein